MREGRQTHTRLVWRNWDGGRSWPNHPLAPVLAAFYFWAGMATKPRKEKTPAANAEARRNKGNMKPRVRPRTPEAR